MSRAVWLVLFALPASAADYGSPVPPGPPVDIPLPAAARRPCDAQAAAMQPAPKTTGVPELDDLLREAKRTGNTVARPFNEDGIGLTWFKATPDGWLSRMKAPPVVQAPPPVPATQPRQEVAVAPPARTFRIPLTRMECEFDASHVCSRCGTTQLVIARWNADGTHTHTCPNPACRHSWRH